MNTERLNKLREAVESAPLEGFDMRAWSCGTQSCAAGWYVRKNPDCGLRLVDDEFGGDLVPAGYTEDDWNDPPDVLAEHFAITNGTSRNLFTDFENGDEPDEQKRDFLSKLARVMAGETLPDPDDDND